MAESEPPSEFTLCNVTVHAVQVEDAMRVVRHWIEDERCFHLVSSTNLNNLAIAVESREYCEVMKGVDLSLPDGVPLLWYGRFKGFPLYKRCGIEELMRAIFEMSNRGSTYSHFFYGNTTEVLADMRSRLLQLYPKLNIAGMLSPPFRTLSTREDDYHVRIINDSGADFLWVSLGCPKQESWLFEHRDKLHVIVGGGAGAVFNFFSGRTLEAPDWVRSIGLEWLLRLLVEPRRLYRRYLLTYPKFILRFIQHALGIAIAR